MYPIVFNKARAQELLAIIGEGKDIPAPAGGWNCDQMLQVAGALLFAAMSHGPVDKSQAENRRVQWRHIDADRSQTICTWPSISIPT